MTVLREIVFVATLFALPVAPAIAATSALVVGIDSYPHEVSLDGAVRDALDVTQALKAADVGPIRQFINEQATKDAIREAWVELVAAAERGDTILFTYAGHGAQMPELIAGSEEDGLDEFLELPGFDRARAEETASEIIVDNELSAWFAEAEAKGIHVLFVSDSCYSGGMNRSISGKTRLAPMVRAKVPPPSKEAISGAKVRDAELSQVTILAASLESQPTPEVVIGGEPRGALSWSFARALEGAADRDGDGRISRVELEDYVFSNVKLQSEALQVPNFTPQLPRSDKEIVLPLPRSAKVAGAETASGKSALKSPRHLGWTGRLPLSVVGQMPGLANVGGEGLPYRWEAASGVFYTPNGDVAGEHVAPDMVQRVVDKFILVDFLKAMAAQSPGTVSLKPVKDIYLAGDRLTFEADQGRYANMLVFNLANTGEVQLLDVQIAGRGSHTFSLQGLEVVKPFGADHLVVISTDAPIDAIAAAFSNSSLDGASLLRLLETRLEGSDSTIAIQPLYTRGQGQ
ncbi:caspase family protein [Ensifer adhaerens]|uniref:caspase family protein n=1 Tax=Ensifer adhaerens TaxID=106592 RepID=UPI00098EFF2D|nr:caspase family protein [Ensifer adhaerens]